MLVSHGTSSGSQRTKTRPKVVISCQRLAFCSHLHHGSSEHWDSVRDLSGNRQASVLEGVRNTLPTCSQDPQTQLQARGQAFDRKGNATLDSRTETQASLTQKGQMDSNAFDTCYLYTRPYMTL